MSFGFILSITLWKLNIGRFRHENTIQRQNNKLEEQNVELQRITEELKTTNAAKDKFFSILAHDLRSPMNGFLGLTELFLHELNTLSEKEIKELAFSLNTSANHIYRLLENLLEWSKIQHGLLKFYPENFKLSTLIDDCIQLFQVVAETKDIKITSTTNENQMFFADKHMLEIILRNLISNSLKYSNRGGNIRITTTFHTDFLKLSVQDDGIGMSPEIVQSLFKITNEKQRKGTANEPSSGLGLILCKECIEKHNGVIQVESKEKKGCIFTVIFPINPSLGE